jgi:hypothetical protein
MSAAVMDLLLTTEQLIERVREEIAKWLYVEWLDSSGRLKTGRWLLWEEMVLPLQEFWLDKSNEILSLRLNTHGAIDPNGNVRIGVYLENSEIPDPDPHSYESEFEAMCAVKESAKASGFRKVLDGGSKYV